MAVKITNTDAKVSAPKRTIAIKGAVIKELKFVDETGDVTNMVLKEIPENLETIDVKITLELPDEVNA